MKLKKFTLIIELTNGIVSETELVGETADDVYKLLVDSFGEDILDIKFLDEEGEDEL